MKKSIQTTGADMKKAGRIRSESVRNSLKMGEFGSSNTKTRKNGLWNLWKNPVLFWSLRRKNPGKTSVFWAGIFFDRLIWKNREKRLYFIFAFAVLMEAIRMRLISRQSFNMESAIASSR